MLDKIAFRFIYKQALDQFYYLIKINRLRFYDDYFLTINGEGD